MNSCPAWFGVISEQGRSKYPKLTGIGIVQRHRGLCRQREQHYLGFVESVPQPDVPPADSSHPCPTDGLLRRLEVRGARQAIGSGQSVDRSRNSERTLGPELDQPPELTRIPRRYSSSSRHES